MSQLTPLELMQLYDEELEVQSELDESQESELGGLLQLSEVLDEVHDHQQMGVGPDFDISSAVLERIAEGAAPRLQLLEGGRLAGMTEAVKPTVAPESTAPDRRPLMFLGVLAAAAAVLLVFYTRGEVAEPAPVAQPLWNSTPTQPAPETAPPKAPPVQEPAALPEEEGPKVAIVAVDFGTGSGSIFVVGEESTPVVWMNDDAAEPTRGKVGPL